MQTNVWNVILRSTFPWICTLTSRDICYATRYANVTLPMQLFCDYDRIDFSDICKSLNNDKFNKKTETIRWKMIVIYEFVSVPTHLIITNPIGFSSTAGFLRVARVCLFRMAWTIINGFRSRGNSKNLFLLLWPRNSSPRVSTATDTRRHPTLRVLNCFPPV